MKRLADEWASYREMAIHVDAPPSQVVALRRTFYAGAIAFFSLQNAAYDPATPDATDEDVAYLESLHEELLAFLNDVKAGRA